MKEGWEINALKYCVWNAMVTGTLIAGYYLDCMKGAGIIIGTLYGVFVIPVNAITILSSGIEKVKKTIADKGYKFSAKIFFEPIWPAIAITMGYKKIGAAMIIEIFMVIFLIIVGYQSRKEYAKDNGSNT